MRCASNILSAIFAVCLFVTFSFAAPQAKAPATSRAMRGVPNWEEVKAKIESQWKVGYAQEKILKIEKKGEPEFTEEKGSSTIIWDWGWVTTIKGREGSYCRQVALVTVERRNKTRARFTVAALYKLAGGRWQFAEMPVGGQVEELPRADTPALPSDEDAGKIFAEAWKTVRPDFEVNSIEVVGKPKFKRYKDRRWLNYNLVVLVTGTRKGFRERYQKQFKCTPRDFSSVLKWAAGSNLWVADEEMIGTINGSTACEPAN